MSYDHESFTQEDYEYICEESVSSLASGFGFDSDEEFNSYCDDMEADAKSCEY